MILTPNEIIKKSLNEYKLGISKGKRDEVIKYLDYYGEKKEINETFKGQKQEEIKGVCECGSQKFAIRKT